MDHEGKIDKQIIDNRKENIIFSGEVHIEGDVVNASEMHTHSKPKNQSSQIKHSIWNFFIKEPLISIWLGVIASLIAIWILADITNWSVLTTLNLILRISFIILIPLLLREVCQRLNIEINRVEFALLAIFFTMSSAACFSEFPAKKLPMLPSDYPQEQRLFNDEYLLGSYECRFQDIPCTKALRVRHDEIVRIESNSATERNQLHILLDVEWYKQETSPIFRLRRNYEGMLYYTINYNCSTEPWLVETAILEGYLFTPESRFLSWMIGFLETPFIQGDDNTITKLVQKNLEERNLICPQ